MDERYKKILTISIAGIFSLLVLGIVVTLSAAVFMLVFNWIMPLFGITVVLPFRAALGLMVALTCINAIANELARLVKRKLESRKE